MKIVGIEGLTAQQLRDEVNRGGRFVIYGWCVSLLVVTLRRSSDVTFVRADRSPAVAGLGWTALSFFLGWWGFPWGLVYTPMVIIQNLSGGKDVTREVMLSLSAELGGAVPSAAASPTGPSTTPGPPTTRPGAAASPTGLPTLAGAPPTPGAPAFPLGSGAPPTPASSPLPSARGPSSPTPTSGTATRDIVGLVLAVVSFCCAPVGWVSALLAILSLRDARARGERLPILPVISIVVASLTTLLTVVFVGLVIADETKANRRAEAAAKEAAAGRRHETLDARTACSLATAALWNGAFELHRNWDSLDCVPPLTNDAVTPAIDLTAKRASLTNHLTVCFARSNVRWYVLSARESTVCPEVLPLTVPSQASDDELERLEQDQRRLAENAPDKRFKPKTPDLVAEPTFDEGDDLRNLQLLVNDVVEGQKPSATPPFHVRGGKWTYFDVAPLTEPACAVRVGLPLPPRSNDLAGLTDVMVLPPSQANAICFLEALGASFSTPVPEAVRKPSRLPPVKLGAAVLGQGLQREEGGGFTTPPAGRPGNWVRMKLFLQRDQRAAEVFFNVNLEAGVGELSEADAAYREDLLALMHRALLDGW